VRPPLLNRVALKILRSLLRTRKRHASAFFGAVVESLFETSRGIAIDSIATVLSGAKASEVDALIQALYARNGDLAAEAIASAFSRSGVSDRQAQVILRASLSRWVNNEMPQGILDTFQEISGCSLHYSQEGEDVLFERIFPAKNSGFFVDIGAHHPRRFSNTYALYRRGWRGINVDATPGSMELFRRLRPKDINLECAVSNSAVPAKFHVFEEGALNTFDQALAREYIDHGWALKAELEMDSRPLSSILREHLPAGTEIDLLNVDVEGQEMSVLSSNDWGRFRPELIVMEVLSTSFQSILSHPTIFFVLDKGYELMSRLGNSVILRRRP
jgi:FkbM family methyltransferase